MVGYNLLIKVWLYMKMLNYISISRTVVHTLKKNKKTFNSLVGMGFNCLNEEMIEVSR